MPDMLTTPDAAAQLGISPTQFRNLAKRLGWLPDGTYANPMYRTAAPGLLYSADRVHALVGSRHVIDLRAKSSSRREAAVKAAETRRQKLAAEIQAWCPSITVLAEPDVRAAAIDHYNVRNYERRASRSDSAEFLSRITENYIRHCLTDYEDMLARLRGRTGQRVVYEALLRPIVDRAIAAAYPWLVTA